MLRGLSHDRWSEAPHTKVAQRTDQFGMYGIKFSKERGTLKMGRSVAAVIVLLYSPSVKSYAANSNSYRALPDILRGIQRGLDDLKPLSASDRCSELREDIPLWHRILSHLSPGEGFLRSTR